MTLASLSLPGVAVADNGYLTWQHKSDAQTPAAAPTVSSGGQDYAVPPSPYGQIGDPFARTLTWSGKDRPQQQQPQAQPRPQPPVATAPATQPRQVSRPPEAPRQQMANVDPLPVPQHSIPQVTAPVPVPQPKPVTVPEAALRPAPQLRPAQQQVPALQRPVQPATQTASSGYQVPATSKYASRIASARAAAATQQADATPPAKPDVKPSGKKPDAAKTATAPTPSPQMATEETDHVFIPGEQYKNASDAPRLYSLHRAYGLTPDPITVDHNATGAILDTADIDADKVEEAKDKASDGAKSSSDDSSAKTADAPKADTRKVTQ
ncbi:MAG: hypothetical protein JF571_08870 [Asticcacaulis sp.]|nr:hypothetical protein [Asticcacaulis sp.]